jgi:Asp-tRNA(Asn)/Glu-tRNA(Gln) amidotransferase A subunit family amidase
MTLQALIAGLRSGEQDLPTFIDQLETRFNEREPDVLAFVPEDGRFARLRREAQQLLEQFPHPAARPPLFGLPVGVKDIFHVHGFLTRAGSQLPAALLQGLEAESVTVLRQAGALILGKTVTTEFAYFGPGPTRNPHHPEHTPGGSSSGSAAAVGAGLCHFAFGTQTIGSINRPAAFCGVVGFKPSYGRISTSGVIPLSVSLDHVGFFTHDIAGAELMAGYLCRDWQGPSLSDSKPTLGIPNGRYLEQAGQEGLAHFRADCERLIAAGFTIKPVDALSDIAEIRRRHLVLMAAEAARFHAQWFEEFESRYHPKTAELIRQGRTYSEEEVRTAQACKLGLREQLTGLMDAHSLDLWISPPATGPAPHGLDSTGDPIMNLPWTNAGLPTLTLPTGFNEAGLPMGLQLTGRRQADEWLFAHGKAIEETFSRN